MLFFIPFGYKREKEVGTIKMIYDYFVASNLDFFFFNQLFFLDFTL